MEQVAVQTWPAKVLSGADTGHKIDNSDGQIHLHHHAWYIHNCNPGSGKWQSRAPAKMWSRLGCVIHFIQGGGVGTGIPNRRYGNRACGTLPRDHDTSWPLSVTTLHMIYLLWQSLTAPSVLPRSGNSLLSWNQHKFSLLTVYRICKNWKMKNMLCALLWNLKNSNSKQIPSVTYMIWGGNLSLF